MFSDELYSKLKKNRLFKGFILYCIIGGVCFAAIGIALIASARLLNSGFLEIAGIVLGLLCLAVPAGFIIGAFGKPHLCAEGEITEINKRKAAVSVGGITVKGSSFENFVFNKSLEGYKVGDKVLIYSKDKKMSRPLFVHS